MNTLAKAVKQEPLKGKTKTTNGMTARKSSGERVTDLFYKAGAMRGQDIIPLFNAALADDEDLTLRLAQWLRDVRGGAGERAHYRAILKHLERVNHPALEKLIIKTPEIGRWDDLLVFETKPWKEKAYDLIMRGLQSQETSGLVAKWLPREKSAQSALAADLRKYMELTPKAYRKLLVSLTNVVESRMCAKDWDEINFSHVPSLANTRYRKAFLRNAKETFESYIAKLVKGDNSVKVNVEAIYPHQVLQEVAIRKSIDTVSAQFITAQWNAMPQLGDKKILPIIDVSSSMTSSAHQGKNSKAQPITCMHIAISLGMYVSMKNEGPLKNMYLTFSDNPVLDIIKNTDLTKAYWEVKGANWGGSTDLQKSFELLLNLAASRKVKPEDMPEYIMIISDMQFNQADRTGKWANPTARQMIKQKFKDAGYNVPNIIFWNVNSYDNVPVKFDTEGTALVSGFSPSILKAVMSAKFDQAENAVPLTPYEVMLETLMQERYAL